MYRLRRHLAFRFTLLKHSFRLWLRDRVKWKGRGRLVVTVSWMAKRATKLLRTRDVAAGGRARDAETRACIAERTISASAVSSALALSSNLRCRRLVSATC